MALNWGIRAPLKWPYDGAPRALMLLSPYGAPVPYYYTGVLLLWLDHDRDGADCCCSVLTTAVCMML